MARTYRWAFITPGRKVFYNLTITVLSVVVALVVGGIGLIGLLTEQLQITDLQYAASASSRCSCWRG
ncbi:hypothetical protein TOK_1759 [Pseudonocardia sp. N23]|nr:MHYT domain-containing protein [Pseudonocardia sp. N23]GAY13030.1 hypothetical protein TOK_1759 [Pseudonocardia sp. N23]